MYYPTLRNQLQTYQAGDYAGVDGPDFSIYYGYEYGRTVTDDPDESDYVWGFRYTKGGEAVFEMPYTEMQKQQRCPDQYECAECVIFGLALYLMSLDKASD